MLHELIYKIGVNIRSPELKEKYEFLVNSEKWSLDELEAYQLKRLKRIVSIAYDKSVFYKMRFDKLKISPDSINSLKDIKKLPVLTKGDILENISSIQNKDGYRKLFFSETSGSTGEPLIFYRNSEWDAGHRAAQLRGYSWYNVHPWENNGYFWGYDHSLKKKTITKFYDFLLNRFRMFSYTDEEIISFAQKLKKAEYLEGYSSMIYEVAKTINQKKLGKFKLKMVKGTSEKIYENYQVEAERAFGKRIISEYGAAETGIIAFECPHGNMHIVMENVIVEEENGEAIITNLISDSFPIIRYKLGDSIILDEHKKCPCGMEHKIIMDVVGRVGKVIYGRKNKYPSLTLYYIFKNLALKYNITLNYQIIQKEKGEIDIYLDINLDVETERSLREECYKYFFDDVLITIYQNQLKRDYSKKFTDFISYIN